MTPHPLLGIDEVARTEPYLRTVGEVFRAFRDQDSSCVSYGVRLADGERWFVKEATTEPVAPAWTGSVNDLDESNLPWNARMAQDGTIIIL
ncbi:hypothetical protein PV963_16880 [Streptomyces coeruleorubidus]|uniref:hypothetical protein n=1 Tax=Streptomyces coeruleorubidus TaxID=116188 RepID=UPI00237F0DE3|nr:hypothetical protein [Streptomyces coeruleorubidus]WDV51929.1 hypothetical protein PV963_16880 [Streptomyces coeruleorubidus]